MNKFTTFLTKVFIFFWYKKDEYFFWRSKKFILNWGTGTYGIPTIISYDGKSCVSVGKYCSIASNVSFLLGANHKRGLITTYPISMLNKNKKPTDSNEPGDIHIGNDVWIGYGATLIGGISIGDGAIIGAGAVVIKDVPPYAVVTGVPAEIRRFRFDENSIEGLIKIKWWDWSEEKIKQNEEYLYSKDISTFISSFS